MTRRNATSKALGRLGGGGSPRDIASLHSIPSTTLEAAIMADNRDVSNGHPQSRPTNAFDAHHDPCRGTNTYKDGLFSKSKR